MTVFWERMNAQFGEQYAASVARDQQLHQLGDRSPAEALDAGEEPRVVWLAVCEHFDVPVKHRH